MLKKVKSFFKILTFILPLIICSPNILAAVVEQDNLKTHVRWRINVNKEQINITKKGSTVSFKSLDPEFFEKFAGDITKLSKNTNYHKQFKFKPATMPGEPNQLDVYLADDSIELFSFYKKDKSQYILDYWINQDVIATKKAAVSARPKVVKVTKLNKRKPKKKKVIKRKAKSVEKALSASKTDKFKVINASTIIKGQSEEKFRDFRYGAAFVWDYAPLIPTLERDLDLSVKAPDYLYKVKDRKQLSDKKEEHMQLSINFYNKAEWGLMTRSINLYEERYGKDRNADLNDYMKAVSMLKNTIKQELKPNYKPKLGPEGEPLPATEFTEKGIQAAARSLLVNVVDSTQNYELAKAVLRYQIQYSIDEKDYVGALEYAKNLYVKGSEAFDDEMTIYSSRVILNSLAHLRQLGKISEFLKNKAVMRVLPKQEGLAYINYVNLFNKNTKQVIADFVANKASMTKPIHPSILFNTAEAYFRQASYKKAVKLFDEFVANYSFISKSGEARLRIALAYDLNGEDHKKVMKLYKDAINKTSILDARYEAKLRYVGLRSCRKKELTEGDKEVISFLEATAAEKSAMTDNHKKLLWLVRLRTMINTHEFEDALAYLSTLPLDSVRLIDKRTFQADGAEVVLGIIQKAYLKGDYGRAVKVWELYKNRYENKVAKNPYMNFIVSDSFLKLGLFKSHERSMEYLKNIKTKRSRAFPLWVNPHKNISSADYVVELKINKYLKSNDYNGLAAFLETQKNNKSINYKFYNGLVSTKLKKYNSAVTSFESLLVRPNSNNILTPDQSITMLESYLESLYQVGPGSRFRKNAAALANDLRRQLTKKTMKLVTRADYLYIESLFAESKTDYKLMTMKTNEFLKANKKTEYFDRVTYLNGVALINNNQKEEGKKVLNTLIGKEGVPEYLKGLAKSELSTLVLENKTL